MRLSIALCTCNGERFLADQLASYVSQIRLPDELVVCDDGSTDGTMAILENFARNASFPIHLHRNVGRLGVGRNFERAACLCAGDIILFSDQDDIWHPQKLQRVENAFALNREIAALFCDAELIDQSGFELGRTVWQSHRFSPHLQRMMLHGYAIEVMLRVHPSPIGMSIAIRQESLSWLKPFPDNNIGYDRWAILLSAFVRQATIIPEVLAKYRQHGGNVSGGIQTTPLGNRLMSAVAKEPKETRQRRYLDRMRIYEALRSRLLEIDQVPNLERKLLLLDQKIKHLSRRAEMPFRRMYRVPYILRECVSLNYHRYSGGLLEILRDCVEKDRRY